MMEEASEEQPEMVSHEEAVQAEKEATANLPTSLSDGSPQVQLPPTLNAPSPLPAFLTQSTNSPSPVAVSTPSRASPAPSQPAVRSPSTPVRPPGPLSSAISHLASPAPESQQIPHEVKNKVPDPVSAPEPENVQGQGPSSGGQGLFGWISSSSLMNKVVEKTKSTMESVITTMDPGMKGVIYSGGDIEVAVTSTKESKVLPVREAFQAVFGKATITGNASQATTAAQPVGFTAGLKGAEERITNLRKSGSIPDGQAVVSVEGFIVEILPDRWFEMSCLLLKDPTHGVELQTFSQPTLIPNEYVLKAQDRTPSDYPLKWAGFAVTIGEVIEEAQPHIGHADWQMVLSGVSRQQSLLLAARALAYMYQERLPTSFVS